MSIRRPILAVSTLLVALTLPASAQQTAIPPDSARAQISAVLRSFYLNLESGNWNALSGFVLSPKLLERRGAPGDLQMAARDRSRGRGTSHKAAPPATCPSSGSTSVDDAIILVDGDWAEVSVPRCRRAVAGVDEFRLLYFEERWRFIYTDLFEASPNVSAGR